MSKSYYKDNLPELIERLKNSLTKIAPIIDQDIDPEIKDDKLFNVLKAKRQASEDYIWTMKRIEELEHEVNGTEPEEVKSKKTMNPTKQFSRK